MRLLGSYWTVPTRIPLMELTGLPAFVHTWWRLQSIEQAKRDGVCLPPIELGVHPDGRIWLVDGNHRLTEARQSGRYDIEARLTFVGT